MQTLSKRYQQVLNRIHAAEQQFQRPRDSVALLAVSKKQSAETVEALFRLGQRAFGESYLQEAVEKIRRLESLPIRWHFIGRVQSNKTRVIAEHFDWVHSIDRLKSATRLNDQRPENLSPLNICLQIKLDDEPGKTGIAPERAAGLAGQITRLRRLNLRGLMCIPAARTDPAEQRRIFARLRELQAELRQTHPGLDTLSMGMSDDLESAIAEGATLVRIGTAIFGERP